MTKATKIRCLLVVIGIIVSAIAMQRVAPAQDFRSQNASSARTVPLGAGYCSVEGPYLITMKAGASFEVGPYMEYKGRKFQITKPKTPNAYGISPITIRLLTKTKQPSGPSKTLECDSQNWNEKQNTVAFHYRDDAIHVIVYVYPASGGSIIEDIECLSPDKAK